jgi:multidrug efflux system membrane fusion protein
VASGTALTQADQAAVDNAKTQLSYTEIRAPLSGRIGFRQVDVGNIVRANDTQGLLSIVQIDPINVLYTLPEGDLATLQQALAKGRLTVVATVVGQRITPTVTGAVAVVNNQVDQASGTVQIKAVFDNKDLRLWPGQSVTTKTRIETLENVIVIPASVIQHGPNGLFVWRIVNDVAEPGSIKVRDQDTAQAVVSSGLAVGDRIVTAGQLRLRKGVKVEAREVTPDQQASLMGATP